ncbi:MAG: MucB/RseB C-terminal domain-containing protein [Betaproteobacteria bacterium]|nr:MucB/RseB C-terminal domain-containing protein [Betaproteobacteria bacterium]
MQAVFQVARSGLVVLGFVWPLCGHATEAIDWLHRAASAAQRLNYTGTILYQHGTRIETSRIVHYVDPTGEYEKLVNLDGPPREVIRNNEQVTCYLPDSKLVRIESRASRSVFPSLLPNQIATLAQNYIMREAEPARVAGRDAQAFLLEPRDGMRYGHVFWTDTATGLLLKTRMYDENNRVVEMSAFLEVQINAKVDRSMVESSFPARPADWLVQRTPAAGGGQKPTGWWVSKLPSGFSKIVEGYRMLPDRTEPVAHLVYTDGLVAVSVFVEIMPGTPQLLGLSQQGAINIYKRQLDEFLVTVLGETPGITVRQIANSVVHR